MAAAVTPSPDQRAALEIILAWLEEERRQILTLGGYAGTGKTTVIRELVRIVRGAVAVCAFTGKAAHVLRTKDVDATTAHALLYQPSEVCRGCGMGWEACEKQKAERAREARRDPHLAAMPGWLCPRPGKRTKYMKRPFVEADLIIVDEASMVSGFLARDLESFGIKVLYVGDHGQLEPIGENPGLMKDPEIRLEKIHRQAEGSGILAFAHHVRQGHGPEKFGEDARVQRGGPADLAEYDAVICGYNKKRVEINAWIRRKRGFAGELPQPDERLICLRNSADAGVFNGMLVTVDNCEDGFDEDGKPELLLDCHDDAGHPLEGLPIAREQFGRESRLDDVPRQTCLFDFGYCITAHKSQGSEFDRVCVLEQISQNWNAARWRYTAATRAAKELLWCLPK